MPKEKKKWLSDQMMGEPAETPFGSVSPSEAADNWVKFLSSRNFPSPKGESMSKFISSLKGDGTPPDDMESLKRVSELRRANDIRPFPEGESSPSVPKEKKKRGEGTIKDHALAMAIASEAARNLEGPPLPPEEPRAPTVGYPEEPRARLAAPSPSIWADNRLYGSMPTEAERTAIELEESRQAAWLDAREAALRNLTGQVSPEREQEAERRAFIEALIQDRAGR